jgi:WD repeat-containing protein 19
LDIAYFFRHCTGFGWDSDGDMLGMICDGSYSITLWDSNTGKTSAIESGFRDMLSLFVWAKNEPLLAVATIKGNLTIYNHRTSKYVIIL